MDTHLLLWVIIQYCFVYFVATMGHWDLFPVLLVTFDTLPSLRFLGRFLQFCFGLCLTFCHSKMLLVCLVYFLPEF